MGRNIRYRALAEFRYEIRRYLNFSERAARTAGLEPQQHQALLVVKGIPEGRHATIGYVAERLQIPVLPAIRVDASVTKASRARQFLVDYDPRSRAVEDYAAACQQLAGLLREQTNERWLQMSA
jgi:MinD-like ATPase involved in chromosome partitioning or flagellar assembly